MKTLVKAVLVLILATATTAWTQTPAPAPSQPNAPSNPLEEKLDQLANTRYEFLSAEVLFRVLDLKREVDFDILGKKKGFHRNLTRVTAKLTNIKIAEPGKLPMAEKYLEANASEIDLAVKIRSSFANGYFAASGSLFPETVEKFLAAYKANKNATFKGYVTIRVATPPNGVAQIDKIQLSGLVPEPVQ